MPGFVKPTRKVVNIEDAFGELIGKKLIKDLHDNEEICPVCHGTGLRIEDNPYGLSDDPDKRAGQFPYKHQSIQFCPNCYNGVVRFCPDCGKQIPRYRTLCDCDAVVQRRQQEENRKEKERLEKAEKHEPNFLTRRVPAIIRLDGKAFHTFTKGMEKPFDLVLTQAMQETMKHLCENIQGCVLGYTQSDEITLVLTDYATIQTDAWFGYNIQKMCSVSASMATMAFNREFERIAEDWFHDNGPYWKSIGVDVDVDLTIYKRYNAYQKKMFTAMFDSRVFSVPKEEVCNCLIWRQQDATRNSIEAVGQANFSHHELHKKTCNMIQEMLWSQRGINWNDFLTELRRGSCCIKRQFEETIDDPRNPDQKITVCRNRWIIDHEIPIFTQDREYIERLI